MTNSFFYHFDPHSAIRIFLLVLLLVIGNYLVFYDYFQEMSFKRKVGLGGFLFLGNFIIFSLIILLSMYFPILPYDIAEAEKEKSNPACENRIRMAESRAHERACRQTEEGIQKNQVSVAQEKQPGKTYPITDGETYRILAGRKYVCEDTFWADSAHVEILEMRVNGKWTELFRAKDLGDNNCFSIMSVHEKSIRLSPLEDYVEFSLVGYEWSEDMLINTKTKNNLFPQDMHSSGLVWSKNARSFAFVSNLEEFGGSGVDKVVVSGFNNPDALVDVLKLESWAKGEDAYNLKYEFRDLQFIDNQNIEFSIHRVYDEDNSKFFGEIARYQYDLEKARLTKLSGE